MPSRSETSGRRTGAVGAFLAVAFGLSWVYTLAYDALLGPWAAGTPLGRVLPYLSAWGPLAAAAVAAHRSGVDVRSWFGDRLTPGGRPSLYLFALLLPNAVSSAAMVVFPLRGVALELSVSAANFALVFGFTFLLLGALEEFGWRGYLQPALRARTDAATAAVVVGVAWALWHLPAHALGYLGDADFALFAVHLVPMSVVMAWLYGRAEGLLPVMAFHAAHNAPGNVFAVVGDPPARVAALYYPVYTGLWLVVGALFVAYHGRDLGARDGNGDQTGGRLRPP